MKGPSGISARWGTLSPLCLASPQNSSLLRGVSATFPKNRGQAMVWERAGSAEWLAGLGALPCSPCKCSQEEEEAQTQPGNLQGQRIQTARRCPSASSHFYTFLTWVNYKPAREHHEQHRDCALDPSPAATRAESCCHCRIHPQLPLQCPDLCW